MPRNRNQWEICTCTKCVRRTCLDTNGNSVKGVYQRQGVKRDHEHRDRVEAALQEEDLERSFLRASITTNTTLSDPTMTSRHRDTFHEQEPTPPPPLEPDVRLT